MTTARVIAIGECMAELSGSQDRGWNVGYGGDTLNTSVYLARLLGPAASVSYMTRIGGDLFGRQMLQSWAAEGLATDLAEVVADRTTGFYAISTDEAGERSFTYWRDRAPARDLLNQPLAEIQRRAILAAKLLYFSGITLAILGNSGRSQLIDLAEGARSEGRMVAFDTNYRARLWASKAEAKEWTTRALRSANVALSSCEDMEALFGLSEPAAAIRLMSEFSEESVLRDGSGPVTLRCAGTTKKVHPPADVRPVDTTGAGDSFNAAYLAARLAKVDPARAARLGCKLAATVVCYPGAIIPRSAMPELEIKQLESTQ